MGTPARAGVMLPSKVPMRSVVLVAVVALTLGRACSGDTKPEEASDASGASGSPGAAGGGASGLGGSGSAASGGIAPEPTSCDPRKIMCKRAAPACEGFQVPSVLDACYGPCVDIERCACTEARACPDDDRFTCHMNRRLCGPYVR